jgi:hypothetical protein
VKVRTIRPHDTTEGMKAPGDEYDRPKAEADKLTARGVVELAPAKVPAKRTKKRQ